MVIIKNDAQITIRVAVAYNGGVKKASNFIVYRRIMTYVKSAFANRLSYTEEIANNFT